MSDRQSGETDMLRVIFCMLFDHRAPARDIAAFKQALIACPNVLHSVELTGSFDFMLEAALPGVAAYQDKLTALAEPLARLVARYETNFVCKRFIRDRPDDQAIWIPTGHGHRRIDRSTIDKVTAEGDYMRIHAAGRSWLVHATMHSLRERLDPRQFVQIHRSVLVRLDHIDRFVHERRRWTVRLVDGSVHPVAKGHVAEVLRALQADSSIDERPSPKPVLPGEMTAASHRNEAARVH